MLILLLLLGMCVGLVMGLTGAGGGILAVPLLLAFMHLTFAEAVPVAMLATATAAGMGMMLGLKAGQVRYRAALFMAAAGVLAAPLGIWLGQSLDHALLSIAFASILLIIACRTVCGRNPELPSQDQQDMPCLIDRHTGRIVWSGRCSIGLGFAGTLTGFLSGLIGVGGGFVLVPALQRLSVLTMASVMSTALTVMFLVSLSVVVGHVVIGKVLWPMALPFALAAMVGVVFGRRLAAPLSRRHLQIGFALLTTLAAAILIYRA